LPGRTRSAPESLLPCRSSVNRNAGLAPVPAGESHAGLPSRRRQLSNALLFKGEPGGVEVEKIVLPALSLIPGPALTPASTPVCHND